MIKNVIFLILFIAGLHANEMETTDLNVSIDSTKHVDKLSQTLNNSDKAIKIIKNKGYAKVYATNGKSFEFNVDFNGNGFIFNEKDYNTIMTLLKDGVGVRGTITTHLMIPDDIKADTVDVKINGSTNEDIKVDSYIYAWYNTYINGQKDKSELHDIKVKHNNGLRYIELAIEINGKEDDFATRCFPDLVRYLSHISYIAKDSKDGEKWYALKPTN